MGGVRAGAIGFSAVLAACTALSGLSDITAKGRQSPPDEAGGVDPETDGRSAIEAESSIDPPNPVDGTAPEAAGPSRPGTPGVTCGSATCTGGQHCCTTNGTSYGCTAGCSIYDYACDDPADCPAGEVCCGTETNVGVVVVTSSRCSVSCSGRVLCATSVECGDAGSCVAVGPPSPASLKKCN